MDGLVDTLVDDFGRYLKVDSCCWHKPWEVTLDVTAGGCHEIDTNGSMRINCGYREVPHQTFKIRISGGTGEIWLPRHQAVALDGVVELSCGAVDVWEEHYGSRVKFKQEKLGSSRGINGNIRVAHDDLELCFFIDILGKGGQSDSTDEQRAAGVHALTITEVDLRSLICVVIRSAACGRNTANYAGNACATTCAQCTDVVPVKVGLDSNPVSGI